MSVLAIYDQVNFDTYLRDVIVVMQTCRVGERRQYAGITVEIG